MNVQLLDTNELTARKPKNMKSGLQNKVDIFCWNFEIFQNFPKNEKISEGRSCSTSYSSGNQVDGSPLVAIMTRRVGVFFFLEE